MVRRMKVAVALALVAVTTVGHAQVAAPLRGGPTSAGATPSGAFNVYEATVADIQRAIQGKRVTTVGIVEQYLRRIRAYNGTCVNEPQGILGPITTIPRAGQINALATLNREFGRRLGRGEVWP